MLKAIRWPGFIGFLILSTTIVVVAYFYAEKGLRWGLESSLESTTGAPTDIGAVDIHLSPLSLTIKDIQVANPDNLAKNAFQLDIAHIDIDILKLFQGKTIIDSIKVSGAAVDKQRKKPAKALPKKVSETKEPQPSLAEKAKEKIPSVQEVMANEPLQTVAYAKQLEADIKQSAKDIEAGFQSLPTVKDIQTLADKAETVIQETKAIKISLKDPKKALNDVKDKKAALDEITAQSVAYKQAIVQQKQLILERTKQIQQQFDLLKQGPQEDYDRLKKKYAFNEGNIMKLSATLFGDKYTKRIQEALVWYERLEPYLQSDNSEEQSKQQRQQGQFVSFKTERPLPDLLISEILMDLELNQQSFEFTADHITDNQNVLNKTTKVRLLSEKDSFVSKVDVTGEFNRLQQQKQDQFNINIEGVTIEPSTLLDTPALNVALAKTAAAVKGKVSITDGQLDGELRLFFLNSDFSVQGKGELVTYLADVMDNINQFYIGIQVTGTIKDMRLVMKSDIDNQISDEISQLIADKKNEYLQKIEAALKDKLAEVRAPIDEKIAELTVYQQRIENLDKEFEKGVNAKLAEAKMLLDEQKAKFTEQAQAFLDETKRKLEEEAAKLKAAAEAEAAKLKAAAEAEAAKLKAIADEKAAKAKAEADKAKAQLEAKKKQAQEEAARKQAELDAEKKRLEAELKAKKEAEEKAAKEKAKEEAGNKLKGLF